MKEYRKERDDGAFDLLSIQELVRVAGAVLGFAVTVTGLVLAVRLFSEVFDVVRDPARFGVHLQAMAAAVGGKDLDVSFAGMSYRSSNLVAIVVFGGSAFLLMWLSLGMLVGGAKIIGWALSERDAVKRILVHAFGHAAKPGTQAGNGPPSL